MLHYKIWDLIVNFLSFSRIKFERILNFFLESWIIIIFWCKLINNKHGEIYYANITLSVVRINKIKDSIFEYLLLRVLYEMLIIVMFCHFYWIIYFSVISIVVWRTIFRLNFFYNKHPIKLSNKNIFELTFSIC